MADRTRMAWVVLLLCAVACPGTAHGREVLLADDFGDGSQWQKRESRHNEEIVTEGISVDVKRLRDSSRQGAFLRVEDRSPRDHWFWLEKRKTQGVWDLSRAARVTLWARSNGPKSTIRFLVGDRYGNIAYYVVGRLDNTDWEQKSLELSRTPPVSTVGVVDWCCVTLLGLRTDPGHGYTFDFRDLRIESQDGRYVTGTDAETILRPPAPGGDLLGFLAPVSSSELGDSILAINLTGSEEEADLDRIARAGVKWAKLSCMKAGDDSGRTERIVDALLARRVHVVGHLSQTAPWSASLFHGVKGSPGELAPIVYSAEAMAWFRGRVRDTAERLKGRVCVWEIGNEPDTAKFWMPTPDPAAFGRFMIETSLVLKAVDPQNKVISGGVCAFGGSGFPVALDFLTKFLSTGAGAHIDFLGLHPYRSQPEWGAGNKSQREVADEVRQILSRSGLSLPLWDTEWQITGAVDRFQVQFATDLYEAKGMLRKYLVEADAGFTHMNWQIAKARPNMEHPGQILTADGRETAKYVTLSHTGALLAKIAARAEVPVRLAGHAEKQWPVLVERDAFDDPSAIRRWTTGAGASAAVDVRAPYRGAGSLRLSGTEAARMETKERWRPVPGAAVLEVRGVWKGNGCEAAIYPTPRDAMGCELPPPPAPKRPMITPTEFAPFCFRFVVAADWHDFGLRIELAKGGTALVDDLAILYPVPPAELVSFAFRIHGSPAPAVFFWTPARPSDTEQRRAADLAVGGLPDAEYALLDTLTGELRRLARPVRNGGDTVFGDLPLCDYPMAIVPRDAFPSQRVPVWLAGFANADEVVTRSFRDRKGDFYLRGFWSVAYDLADRAPAADPRLEALGRMRSFWRRFNAAPQEVAIRPARSSRMVLRPGRDAWHDSVANPRSKSVNRFFYQLDDADDRATVYGLRMADRGLPERPWADAPANAFTWFVLRREGRPSEVFAVVPKGHTFDGREIAIDVSLPLRAKALLLRSQVVDAQCVVYWTEAVPGQEHVSSTVELEDRGGWSSGVSIVDPRTGAVSGKAAIKTAEGGRVVVEISAASQPLLLVPDRDVQKVVDALGRE